MTNKDGGKERNANNPLKTKYKLFCYWYNKTHNGSEAIRQAGFKARQPHTQANRLLKNEQIRHEIERLEAETMRKIEITKPQYLQKVAEALDNAKQESTKARLLQLLGDTLGYTKKEEQQSNVNIFASVDAAKSFLLGNTDTNAVEPPLHMGKLDIVDSMPTTAQENGIDTGTQDVVVQDAEQHNP